MLWYGELPLPLRLYAHRRHSWIVTTIRLRMYAPEVNIVNPRTRITLISGVTRVDCPRWRGVWQQILVLNATARVTEAGEVCKMYWGLWFLYLMSFCHGRTFMSFNLLSTLIILVRISTLLLLHLISPREGVYTRWTCSDSDKHSSQQVYYQLRYSKSDPCKNKIPDIMRPWTTVSFLRLFVRDLEGSSLSSAQWWLLTCSRSYW